MLEVVAFDTKPLELLLEEPEEELVEFVEFVSLPKLLADEDELAEDDEEAVANRFRFVKEHRTAETGANVA